MNRHLTQGQRALLLALLWLPCHPDEPATPDLIEMGTDELPDHVLAAVASDLRDRTKAGELSHQPNKAELMEMLRASLWADWDLSLIVERVRRENDQLQLPL